MAVVPLIHSSSGGWADSQASAAIAAYMIYQYTPHQERREAPPPPHALSGTLVFGRVATQAGRNGVGQELRGRQR